MPLPPPLFLISYSLPRSTTPLIHLLIFLPHLLCSSLLIFFFAPLRRWRRARAAAGAGGQSVRRPPTWGVPTWEVWVIFFLWFWTQTHVMRFVIFVRNRTRNCEIKFMCCDWFICDCGRLWSWVVNKIELLFVLEDAHVNLWKICEVSIVSYSRETVKC
jgi:hypothetical protein